MRNWNGLASHESQDISQLAGRDRNRDPRQSILHHILHLMPLIIHLSHFDVNTTDTTATTFPIPAKPAISYIVIILLFLYCLASSGARMEWFDHSQVTVNRSEAKREDTGRCRYLRQRVVDDAIKLSKPPVSVPLSASDLKLVILPVSD